METDNDQITLPPHIVHEIGEYEALSQNVPWGISKLDVPSAWSRTKGEGVTVMVLDTGFSGHSDNCNEVKGPSFVDHESDSQDYNGHGSHVVGIIGACDNTGGVVGVAPKAKIISVKVLDKNGHATTSSVLRALKYAEHNRPDIINLSLGAPKPMTIDVYQALENLANKGVAIVVSAGNNGKTGGIMYPARWPMTFAVGAYDIFNKVADFSAIGPEIDFVAPGVEILSTHLFDRCAIMSGTSMAAPFVSGVLALMLAHAKKQGVVYPTYQQIYDRLLTSTVDLGPKGFDNQYGFGMIVPQHVVEDDKLPVQPPKITKGKAFINAVKSFFGFA